MAETAVYIVRLFRSSKAWITIHIKEDWHVLLNLVEAPESPTLILANINSY